MSSRTRPLSPHIGIYRWGWTMSLSILHRATGVALSAGLLALTAWLVAIAMGGETYDLLATCMQSPFGKLVLAGFTFALCYHLANGIRHLAWDAGYGLEVATARTTAGVVVVGALALTLVVLWQVLGGTP
jgi:succinate dehydrogenase / fumarate reductase cytochrome b subunit